MSSSSLRRKVMVLGLDGLTLDVLQPLVAAGQLPTFGRLLAQGASGRLRSVTNMATGPAWASFATGCFPQRHGVLHDYHHRQSAYAFRPTSGSDVQLPPFWQLASEAGRSVIALNVPHTYPARAMNGVLLCGIDAPAELAPGFCYPPDAYRNLRRSGIDYAIDCAFQGFMQSWRRDQPSERVLRAGMEAVRRETENRTRAAEHFMAQLDWDLLVVVYSLPDVYQHFFWHTLQQPTGTWHDSIIAHGYRLLDEHLDRLWSKLPADGLLIVVSDHGFGPATGSAAQLNSWLSEHGWLRFTDQPMRRCVGQIWRQLLALARRHTSYRLRQRLLTTIPRLRVAVESRLRLGTIDWGHTRAYAGLDHMEIWLNLRGRQPQGIVEPADAAATLERLVAELGDWRDPLTDRPRVRQVVPWPYAGVTLTDTVPPDVLLEWNADTAATNFQSTMSGDHAPDGAILMVGAGIRAGSLPPLGLVDVAALTLTALGCHPPPWMEGRVPDGLLDDPVDMRPLTSG